ncbi:MAG: radical SAM/SPASM domain-containing protein [Pseudomonadota bacterium]
MSHRGHEWFDVAEVEVNSRCNRTCAYCPNATEGFAGRETRMSDALFKRIIGMLGEIDFSGRLSFHRFNEPLLRKDLAALVAAARRKIPSAFIVIYTNGDLLSGERYQELIEAGVDNFLVTRHDSDEFPERPFQFVQHPSNFALSGRGGIVSSSAEPLVLPCYAPSEMMIVRTNGDVVLCHEDARADTVLGSLAHEGLAQVWFSERALKLRKLLRQGDRFAAGGPCTLCDCRLHPLPGGAI